jgi:Ni/Co efflux regulator RcnB
MKYVRTKSSRAALRNGLAVLLSCTVVAATAHANSGKGRKDRGEEAAATVELRFTSDDRRIVTDYYGAQARKGNCPPGLAKKNNGCQPPGQAKKWQKGRPLPKDIAYHDLPRELSIRLPVPPPNHHYVQVAGDILMIAIGTSMVIDAIEDITR